MYRIFLLTPALLLAGCMNGGNPLTGGGGPDLELPPGTGVSSADRPVERYEAEGQNGNGYAQSITYDADNDTFTVDNLAFDGDNTYSRDPVTPEMNGFRVYSSDALYTDPVTGTQFGQYSHHALMAEGASGETHVAVVRTGAYLNYGFGGFLYSRDGSVVLPEGGQAAFSGRYAAIRDFNNWGGTEFATGNAQAIIDFEDFNDGNGVHLQITNRRIFDASGSDITESLLEAMGPNQTTMPNLNPVVGPKAMSEAGEITQGMKSLYINESGRVVSYESGNYYGVLSGSGADMELVGVVVVEGQDPRWEGSVTTRETGGFIMERQ
ncbi:MAG: hypothetical protein CR993_08430 [Rhodobacterales bacterium]|nr:MAG: hypothetical protein CR993_08430 [Rhodobacterales bacterium]